MICQHDRDPEKLNDFNNLEALIKSGGRDCAKTVGFLRVTAHSNPLPDVSGWSRFEVKFNLMEGLRMGQKGSKGLRVVGGNESVGKVSRKPKRLTGKQEAFVKGVVSGLSQTDAYRAAYNVGDNCKPATIRNEAWKLASHPDVSQMIEKGLARKREVAQRTGVSRRVLVLERLEAEAMNPENTDAARIRALELLGKHERLFTDVVEQQSDTRSAEQIRFELEQRLRDLSG